MGPKPGVADRFSQDPAHRVDSSADCAAVRLRLKDSKEWATESKVGQYAPRVSIFGSRRNSRGVSESRPGRGRLWRSAQFRERLHIFS